jgi:hypothetical protein
MSSSAGSLVSSSRFAAVAPEKTGDTSGPSLGPRGFTRRHPDRHRGQIEALVDEGQLIEEALAVTREEPASIRAAHDPGDEPGAQELRPIAVDDTGVVEPDAREDDRLAARALHQLEAAPDPSGSPSGHRVTLA